MVTTLQNRCGRYVVGALLLGLGVAQLEGCGHVLGLNDKEYIARAKEHQDKGELKAAVIELKNALNKNANNTEARWLLGNIYLDLGNGAAAEKELLRARDLGIDAATVAAPLGRALLAQRQYDRVLKDMQPKGMPAGESQAWIHVLRGRAYVGKQKRDQAGNEFQAALEAQPGFVPAQVGQAQIAMVRKDYDTARAILNQAVAAAPKSAEAWSQLGDLELVLNHYEQADAAYGKAVHYSAYSAPDRVKKALVKIYRKDYAGGKQESEALKKATPDYPGSFYVDGLLAFENRQFSEAQSLFERALKAEPTYMSAAVFLAAAHLMQGHYEQANQYLGPLYEMFPDSTQVRMMLGSVRLQQGDAKGAEAVVRPMLTINPNDVAALNLMGAAELAQGNTQEGMSYLRKATSLEPNSSTARLRLGMSLLMTGAPALAAKELETAVSLAPKGQRADMALILAHLEAKQFDEAIAAIQHWRADDPKNPMPINLLGLAYMGKGQQEQARQAFVQAMQLAPGDPTAAHSLAKMAMQRGDMTEVNRLMQEVLKHHPGHVPTLTQLALQEVRQGHMSEARKWLEKAVKENPKAMEPRILLARQLLQFGQPADALAVAKEGLDAHLKQPGLLQVIGEAQLAMNDLANAAATFEQLARVSPQSADAHYWLARAYAGNHQNDKARKELDEALRLNSNHLLAKIALMHEMTQENKMQEANRLMQELKRIAPDSAEVWSQQGWLAMTQKHPRDAVSAYQEAQKRLANSSSTVDLAMAQLQAGDQSGGVKTLEDWLARYPGDVAVRNTIANVYLVLNRRSEAKAAFMKVVEQTPKNAGALNNLAWLLRRDDPKKALDYGEQALSAAPDAPMVMDTVGVILLDVGQHDRALRLLRKAADAMPNNPDIRYHLAQALTAQDHGSTEARQILRALMSERRPFSAKADAVALLKSLGG